MLVTWSCGTGTGGSGLGRDKLLQLASSLAAKQMAKAPDACGQEELQLYLHILRVRSAGKRVTRNAPCRRLGACPACIR